MEKDKQVHGWIPEEMFQNFKIQCIKNGITMSNAVKEALTTWIKKQVSE